MLLNPTQSRDLLAHALENGYAILAVNADSPACITDCLIAAKEADSPVIIETSLWQLKGHSFGAQHSVTGVARYIANLAVLANSDRFKDIPVIYHTDHIKGPETMNILGSAIRGIPQRFGDAEVLLHASTVSLDASNFEEEENVRTICQLADIANESAKVVTLEMESAVDDRITDADETKRLLGAVEEKHPGVIHMWAPGVGTQHGLSTSGYPDFHPDTIGRNVKLVEEITGRRFGIALHGSSGLSNEMLTAAAEQGVTKVNWSSASLEIRAKLAQEFFLLNAEKIDRSHKEWKVTMMDNGVQSYVSPRYIPSVIERMEVLKSKGQASKIVNTL